jgi:short-subunit dehydrogenase
MVVRDGRPAKEPAMNREMGAALVTGASSGIGRELARLLGARKHPLVLVARSGDKLAELAAEIRAEHGASVWTFAIDLSRPGSAREVFDFTNEAGVTIDLLVNNAGVGIYGDHAELAPERISSMLQLNVTTLAELCNLYGERMKLRGSGRILNVASTAAYQPTPWMAAYGASKTFVLHFSEALAMELADHGVTVSCISPGPTDTGFFGEFDASGAQSEHFAARDDVKTVAAISLDTMMSGELSRIVGARNFIRALGSRLVSRAMTARIAKGVMRTTPTGTSA